MTAKPKTITHSDIQVALLRSIRSVIQIAVRILILQINGWGNLLVFYRLGRNHQFDSSTGTQRVPQ